MYSRSKVGSGALALGLFGIISSGCAAGISSHPHGLGAGQWNVSLPAAASYSQGLAYGRGGSSARAASTDETLFAEARTAPTYAEETKKKQVHQRKRSVDQAQPTRSEPVTPSPEQMPLAPPAGKQSREELAFEAPAATTNTQLALADTSAVGRYESREAQSQSQQQFRGGDAIVIGASTLVIVILIVLLVLLLV